MNEKATTISVEQAAQQLGIGRSLAYELARNGRLPVLRLGRLLRVPKVQLEAMIAGGGGEDRP